MSRRRLMIRRPAVLVLVALVSLASTGCVALECLFQSVSPGGAARECFDAAMHEDDLSPDPGQNQDISNQGGGTPGGGPSTPPPTGPN